MTTSQGPPKGHQRTNPGPRHDQTQRPSNEPQFASVRFSKPLQPELFNTIAKDAAKRVAAASRDRNKSTQLRRFYDELCLWDLRVAQQPGRFEEYLPFIRMLNAKVAYAEGRKLVDATYVDLLHHTLREVKDAESLSVCKLFWEAFTGFYKQERAE
jgi:CRISPR-associated protein Csm2